MLLRGAGRFDAPCDFLEDRFFVNEILLLVLKLSLGLAAVKCGPLGGFFFDRFRLQVCGTDFRAPPVLAWLSRLDLL